MGSGDSSLFWYTVDSGDGSAVSGTAFYCADPVGGGTIQLIFGVLLPYLPEQFPRLSTVHIMLCFSTSVFMMAALLVTILELYQRERERYRSVMHRWWRIVVGSGVLFFLAGMVSSALEIYFVLSAALLCRRLYHLQEEGTQ